jgi:hypothetical protein
VYSPPANHADGHQQSGKNVGRATHTKTQIVVALVWVVVVAIAEARITLGIVPGAAAHNTPLVQRMAPPFRRPA